MTGLNKQTIALNFGQGLDTKTDPKLVQPGKLLMLENGVFHKAGRIDKRNGYSILSSQTLDSTTLDTGSALATFKDELLQYNKQKIYSFSEGAQKWLDKGAAVSATVNTKQIVNNTYQQGQVDSAILDGVGVYAWADSRGGVRASVYDETTGTTMLDDVSIDSSTDALYPRCIAFNQYIFVFYYKLGSLYVRRISPQNPTAFDAAFTVASDVNLATNLYDVITVGNVRMIVVTAKQGANQIKLTFLDNGPTILSGALAPIFINEHAQSCLTIIAMANREFMIAYHNLAAGVKAFIINNGGSILVAPFVVDATLTVIKKITGCKKRDNSGVQLFYELDAAATYNHRVIKATVSNAGSVSDVGALARSIGLWSKAFSYEDPNDDIERIFVAVTYGSTLQSTYFVIRQDGVLVAKMQPNVALDNAAYMILQNINVLSSTSFSFGLINKTRIFSQNNTVFSQFGVSKTIIDFGSQEAFNYAELGNNLHFVGGFLSMYDGISVVEHGFHLYPENVSVGIGGPPGLLTNGDYQFVACYEWKDNQGNIHRSAPSIPITITIAGGPKSVDFVVDTLRLTAKKDNRTNVMIVVYRTAVNGTIFYRDSSFSSPTFNNVHADTVTYTSTQSDNTLQGNDILYTTGGDLDNLSAPSCKYISVFKNRIFLSGLEDENQVWYSKFNGSGEPVQFAGELTLNVDPQGGPVSALSVLDDKVILFKKDRFYITYGDGPNNAGQNGNFAQPQFVTADIGCSESRSIVRVPQGLMFKTQKGIYSLNPSLGVEYVGAPVEDFNGLTITSATLKSDANQIRFCTMDGNALIFDYYFNQWSTFTNHKSTDSLIWKNQFILLKTDGNVYYENPSVWTDNFIAYQMKLLTAWLSFDSVTGFQRIYDIAFLGEYKSQHKLRCQIGYDFSSAYAPPIIFDPDQALPISHYGDDATYGSVSPYGGDNASYRWKASLTYQKCQSIRFLFEELVTSATEGSQESFTITSIGIQLGVKGHLGRFKESQSIGAQGAQ